MGERNAVGAGMNRYRYDAVLQRYKTALTMLQRHSEDAPYVSMDRLQLYSDENMLFFVFYFILPSLF